MNRHASIADQMEDVTWHGDYFSALCPFHTDTRPSLLVYLNYFECKSCGERGSLRKLEKQISHLPVTISVPHFRGLPCWSRWYSQFGDWDEFIDFAHRNLLTYPCHQEYLDRRGVKEHIKEGHFGYVDGWYTFPVYDPSGRLVDIVIRASPSKTGSKYVLRPREPKESFHLYVPDWKRVQQADAIYLPFGILDAWAIHSTGRASATGTAGKSIPATLLNQFRKIIYIIPDKNERDNMESSEAFELAQHLDWRGHVLLLKYPDDTKDPNDVKVKYGKDALHNLIKGAEEMYQWESTGKESAKSVLA
jgi:DNA primase